MKKNTSTFLLVILLMALVSCAVDKAESSTDTSRRIFNSWMITNGLSDLKPTDVGIYVLSDSTGSGDIIRDCTYIFVKYVKKSLDGSISSHNYEDLAVQLGTWTKFSRFTPTVWLTYGLGIGLRDMILGANITDNVGTNGMKVGGRRQAIIVPWLKDPSSGDEVTSGDAAYIYDVQVTGWTKNITTYQVDSLENFKKNYRGGHLADLDSTYYGMYFKNYPTQKEENDTIADGTSISLWYIGRYLDGVVFDTNIKDSAKFYRIYDESNTYSTLSFTYYLDSATVVSSNSMVRGFSYAIGKMKNYGDHCETFFISNYGYGSSGKGNIPGYEPLFFDIWIKEQ